MAATLETKEGAHEAPTTKSAERRFFTRYTLALVALAFVGFSRSFYLRWLLPVFLPVPPLTTLTVIHGLLVTAFMLAYPLQAWLISSGRRRLHMQLGPWLIVLGLAILPFIYVINAIEYHAPGTDAAVRRVFSAVIPLSLLPLLALFLILGWKRRFDAQAHKRLIILTGCVFIAPAIARIPLALLVPPPMQLLFFAMVMPPLMLSTLVPLWIWDRHSLGRVHSVTKWGTALFAVVLVGRLLIAPTAAWAAIVHFLPGYGVP